MIYCYQPGICHPCQAGNNQIQSQNPFVHLNRMNARSYIIVSYSFPEYNQSYFIAIILQM